MANILFRTSNGAYTNIGGVLTPTKEYPSKPTGFPVGLQRSNSYIKGKPLTATEIDTNFYQLAAETNHVAYCDTQANIAAKSVMTTYFPLESGAHISVRFRHGNTAKSPTLTVQVPNSNDDNNYTSANGASSGNWITYGPFPIFLDTDEQIASKNTATEINLEEGEVYDFFYDDYDLPSGATEDSKTNRVHRWRLKSNGAVHRSGLETVKGFKTFSEGLCIGSETNAYPHLIISQPNLERGEETPSGSYYGRVIFGDKNLSGVNASNLSLVKGGYNTSAIGSHALGGVYSGVGLSGTTTVYHTGMVAFDHNRDARMDLLIGFPRQDYTTTGQRNSYLEVKSSGEDVRRPQFSMTPWLLRRFDTYDGDGTHKCTVGSMAVWSGSIRRDEADGATSQGSNMFGSTDTTILAAGDLVSMISGDVRQLLAPPAETMEESVAQYTATTNESVWITADSAVVIRPRFGLGNVLQPKAPRVVFDSPYSGSTITADNANMTGTQFDAISAFTSDYPTEASLFPARKIVSNTEWNSLNG